LLFAAREDISRTVESVESSDKSLNSLVSVIYIRPFAIIVCRIVWTHLVLLLCNGETFITLEMAIRLHPMGLAASLSIQCRRPLTINQTQCFGIVESHSTPFCVALHFCFSP
jgi:hypothetical protein